MANRPATAKQADLTRYLKACRDAGIPISRTKITRDGYEIVHAKSDEPTTSNDWDEQ